MNTRIKELAKQTITRFDQDMDGSMVPEEFGQWVLADDLQKFAEVSVREWVELTDAEIAEAVGCPIDEVYLSDFRKVEAKIKEKNNE